MRLAGALQHRFMHRTCHRVDDMAAALGSREAEVYGS